MPVSKNKKKGNKMNSFGIRKEERRKKEQQQQAQYAARHNRFISDHYDYGLNSAMATLMAMRAIATRKRRKKVTQNEPTTTDN